MRLIYEYFFIILLIVTAIPAFGQGNEELYVQGDKFMKDGQYYDAYNKYSEYIRSSPDSLKGYVARGYTQIFLKKVTEAIGDFDMAIKLDSMNYKGYAGKGAAYMMILNSQDAARNYLRAIELNPEDVVSMSSLSVILL